MQLIKAKRTCTRAAGVAAIAGFFVGMVFMHRIQVGPIVPETPAAEARQGDGSLVLKRDPAAPVKRAHRAPRGATVERAVSVTVQPRKPECQPVTVDLTLVRERDGMRRVVASSPDGEVLTGLDVPMQPIRLHKPRPWAAGVSYEATSGLYGTFIERDVWRLRFGVDVQQTRHGDVEARARIGWTF